MEKRSTFSSAVLLLLIGSFCQVVPQECDLNFSLSISNPNNIAEFVGLNSSEMVDAGGNSTGSVLVCLCPTITGLPARWQGPNGTSQVGSSQLASSSFPVQEDLPGTAVPLQIPDMFSCVEAGNYTCVIGSNMRAVLVLPVGVDCRPTNVIITPSSNGPLNTGEAVTLQCSAVDPTGSGLSFQWFIDDVLIPEESSSALVLNAAALYEVGTYSCHVSNRVGMKRQMYDLASLIPTSLFLEVQTTTVCFNKAVLLRCLHPVLPSGMFSSTRPSWKEDGIIFALDGGMYRSVTQTSPTEHVLELVPDQSHFVSKGARNYTCFLPLVGGGERESYPSLVRPQDKPLKPGIVVGVPGIWDASINWVNNDNQCFDSESYCGLEYNISWSISSGGSLYSATVPHPEHDYTITGLQPNTKYTVNVRAQCQADKSLSSSGSPFLFTTKDSRNAALSLTAVNDTTCFEMPVYLQCHHPDTTANIEGSLVFASTRVYWKRDGAVLAMDGSTYDIIQQSRNSTTLAVTYHRDDFRDTTNNFTCFIPFNDGVILESNEVQVHLNVSNTDLYHLTAFDENLMLDLLPVVACSLLVTPTTNYNLTVTYALPGDNATELGSHNITTNQTRIDLKELLNISFPYDGLVSVSLQILGNEPEVIQLYLNSSEPYVCLGETYIMNCTSPVPFNECEISFPNWYKDGKLLNVNANCTKPFGTKIEQLSVQIPYSYKNGTYYCASGNRSTDPECLSNDFLVQPLRRPLRPALQSHSASVTSLSFTWTHNKACFSNCIEYNISWLPSHGNSVVNETSFTITGLQPGQRYKVTICAVCNGYPPNCTVPRQYETSLGPNLPGIISGTVVPILILCIGCAIGIALCTCLYRYKTGRWPSLNSRKCKGPAVGDKTNSQISNQVQQAETQKPVAKSDTITCNSFNS